MLSGLLRRKKTHSSQRRHQRRQLGFEPLEARRVLASSTLGAVNGVVFVDDNGSGDFTPGEEISGATVQLWEDFNNNNIFDPPNDMLRGTAITNVNGRYDFAGVESGNYFVVQTNQTVGGVALPQQVSPRKTIDGNGNSTLEVDTFLTDSGPTVDEFPSGTPVTESFVAAEALGGVRKFTSAFLNGPDGEEVAMRTELAALRVNPDVLSIGQYTVTWDGSLGAFDPEGLGGLDLTALDGAGFCLNDVFVDQPGGSITVRVYSDAANFSEATLNNITPLSMQDFFVAFNGTGDANFAPAGGTGADFTDVGAIQLIVTASQVAMDGRLDNFGVFGLDSVTCDFLNESPEPQIDLEKLTNNNQADNPLDPDVPVVTPGDNVTWTYQVTNTGPIDIVEVTLLDDQIGAVTNLVDNGNGDNILQPGEIWIYQAVGTAIEGLYRNEAGVTGRAESGRTAMDSDTSHYRGVLANINIEKLTNDNQADLPGDPDIPVIPVGNSVTWTYLVTNTGGLDLTNVVVTDNVLGTISNIIDMGDGDGVLSPGETWVYSASGIATAGAYQNTGRVDAFAAESQQTVNDTDDSRYFGFVAGINIEKATNGQDADEVGSGPVLFVGQAAIYTYRVTSLADSQLTNVVVIDDNGTPDNTSDDFSPTFLGGDIDGDGILDADEVWLYQAADVVDSVGLFQNIGRVSAQDVGGGTVAGSDASNHIRAAAPQPGSKRDFLASSFRFEDLDGIDEAL